MRVSATTLLGFSATAWAVGETVQTTSGRIVGHAAYRPGFQQVSEYLGIRYAKPATGPLRFAAPVAYKSNDTFVADKFADDCPQTPFGGPPAGSLPKGATNPMGFMDSYGVAMGQTGHNFSEDCLSLNIWTKPQSGEKAKAVLLWIYGGAFSVGSTNAPYYNGARLADEEDVIVASVNYRVNIFGFPNAPGLPDQNVALLDQRLAVEWLRDNIAAFGGDPKRITLFGQSAGAASVDIYAYAHTKDPIVNGFIAQSGSAGVMPGRPLSNTAWYGVSQKLGCGGAEAGEKTVECMRSKPFAEISKASSGGGPLGGAFGPSVDGKIVFGDLIDKRKKGEFIKRPLLVGSNDNERGLDELLASGGRPAAPKPAGGPPKVDNTACGSLSASSARNAAGVKSWRYRYMGVFENTALGPSTGAFHNAEIPMIFGTTESKVGVPKDTPEQAKLVKNFMKAWAGFAKDPESGLEKLGWPVWETGKPTLVRLGYNNQSEPNFASAAPYDAGCAV